MAYQHVLTVYDGTHESEDVLDMVCRIVRPHRARLTILIAKLVPLRKELPTYHQGEDPEVDALVRRAEEFAEARKVKAATSVLYARTLGASVVAQARVHGVDLVALAVPDLERLPSQQAAHEDLRAVLHQTTCAVLLCRPGREPR